MNELDLTVDMIEEQIVKGKLRWLANLNEIHRNYQLEDIRVALYSSGGLEEKGFLLSRLFSFLVTPKYKIHFLVITVQELDEKLLRRFVTTCKRKFGQDDWVFLTIIQNSTIQKRIKEIIANTADPNVGIALYNVASEDEAVSNNVLGKGLKKQLTLTKARFEAFDMPDYMKSFTIVISIEMLLLVAAQTFFGIPVFNISILPLTLLILLSISMILGHLLYKSQYKVTLLMTTKGFELKKGQKLEKKRWNEFKDATIYVTPRRETCIRLYSKDGAFDLPISRVGLSRKDTYESIKQLIK